jgi:hypothetical protein
MALLYLLYRIHQDNQNGKKRATPMEIAGIHGYEIKNIDIKGDGSCMFRSIAEQLDNNQEEYQKYRDSAVGYIRDNILRNNEELRNNFEITLLAEYPDLDIETYLGQMQENRWGDSIMLQALANAHNVEITVINFENYYEHGELNPQVQQFNPGYWNFVRIRNVLPILPRKAAIGYINRNHYLSLKLKGS